MITVVIIKYLHAIRCYIMHFWYAQIMNNAFTNITTLFFITFSGKSKSLQTSGDK